jgi:hypothetical protein
LEQEEKMKAERIHELLADRKFMAYIRRECRRHSSRVELQEDFASAAWEYLSTLSVDLDAITLKRMVLNAIHRAYRHELKERHLMAELGDAYQADGDAPGSCIPAGRTGGKRDGEIVLQGHAFLQEWEPGLVIPLFQTGPEEEPAAAEA